MNKTGFGFLRIPEYVNAHKKEVDQTILDKMVDFFIEKGGNYFDTAYTYLNGASEKAIRQSVIERYPRERVRIADKLPTWLVTSYEECQKYFDVQRNRCGVDFFDVYLLHGLDKENYLHCQREDFFRFLRCKKEEGSAKQIGFSFHDSPELLETILMEHPEVDYVQLQINYLDWKSETIQAERCYKLAQKYGKKVIVMEPVKGGNLANIPEEAERMLKRVCPDATPASWAIRFASDLEAVEIVLSGMNSLEQMKDNMQRFRSLTISEKELLEEVARFIRKDTAIACTGCNYCTDGCPANIPISQYFSLYNEYARYPKEAWKLQYRYDDLSETYGSAASCLECGHCETMCPQKLSIIKNMRLVREVFHD